MLFTLVKVLLYRLQELQMNKNIFLVVNLWDNNKPRNPNWKGRLSPLDLLVLTSLRLVALYNANIIYFLTKQASYLYE